MCRPKDPEKQDCSLCSGEIRESKNMFFGTCSYDTCKLYGDCYYSDLGGVFGDKDCLPKSAVGCTYSTKEDCVGKPDAEKDIKVDVTYENGERTGTTNRITQQSSDYFSFGTCKWQTYTDMDGLSQGVCIKDADGDNAPDCLED
ncbi:MAG: hypothetical protein NT001_05970 [Candidatus Woesearchaeota archaeon]|nr:hypothetical protein [Candidatus Woesearchaeota archaeon]